jgi:hypothetical protein
VNGEEDLAGRNVDSRRRPKEDDPRSKPGVVLNAQKRTRTSTGFYSHQHLKLARLPIPPSGLRIPPERIGKYTDIPAGVEAGW